MPAVARVHIDGKVFTGDDSKIWNKRDAACGVTMFAAAEFAQGETIGVKLRERGIGAHVFANFIREQFMLI